MRGWIAALALVTSTACLPHVKLTAPSPSLTPDERVALFEELRGVAERREGTPGKAEARSLYLANGTRVHHAEDLLPMLRPGSATHRHVAERESAARKRNIWALATMGVFVSGMWWADPGAPERTRWESVAIGSVLVGTLVGAFVAYHYNSEFHAATSRAYWSFTADLAARLDVCVSGMVVVTCDTPTAEPIISTP